MPWGHNILIFTKCSSVEEARYYMPQTLQQGSHPAAAVQVIHQLGRRLETEGIGDDHEHPLGAAVKGGRNMACVEVLLVDDLVELPLG